MYQQNADNVQTLKEIDRDDTGVEKDTDTANVVAKVTSNETSKTKASSKKVTHSYKNSEALIRLNVLKSFITDDKMNLTQDFTD